MTLADIFLGLRIAHDDGPAIREFIGELNTNPKCVRGIAAIEHALNAYHDGSSDGSKQAAPVPPIDVHAVIKTLQDHVAGPEGQTQANP